MIETEDPRVDRSRRAVLDATVALIGEVGIESLTIGAISRRSGVAKTTIYRHWDGKVPLVVDALDELAGPVEAPDTGAFADDLAALAQGLAAGLAGGPWADALPSLVGAIRRDPDLAARHRALTAARHEAVATVVERGRRRGEVGARISVDEVVALVAGPLFYRALIDGRPADAAFVDHVVDRVVTLAAS
jgi:AcrR family transcriptional regulator